MIIPVAPEKIQLIKDMLSDPSVNELYLKYVNMPLPVHNGDTKTIYSRHAAFRAYAAARDVFLGLPPLDKLPPVNDKERIKFR